MPGTVQSISGGCSSEGQALGTGRRDLPRDPYNSVSDEAGPLVVEGKTSGVRDDCEGGR